MAHNVRLFENEHENEHEQEHDKPSGGDLVFPTDLGMAHDLRLIESESECESESVKWLRSVAGRRGADAL